MPKFVGRTIKGAVNIGPNKPPTNGMVPLTYSQAKLLAPSDVMYSLNTSDRGGPRSLAKRWNNWFALASTILEDPSSTFKMKKAAKIYIDKDQAVSKEILEELSKDDLSYIREKVARHNNTSKETLKRLAADKDKGVRDAVSKRLDLDYEIKEILIYTNKLHEYVA